MVKHIIILASSYKIGKRIALDYIVSTNVNKNFNNLIKEIKNKENQGLSIAMHTLSVETNEWKDVVKADPFFEDVKLVKNEEEFMNYLKNDNKTSTIDIANYIVASLKSCTHIRLEKLMYFCYADYLCKYHDNLFDDKIYAFKYGPVIKSIYNTYKGSNGNLAVNGIAEDYKIALESRILNSYNGVNKINSINSTLDKYRRFNTSTLISFTHRKDTPWEHNGKGEKNYQEISDEDILKYHINESVIA